MRLIGSVRSDDLHDPLLWHLRLRFQHVQHRSGLCGRRDLRLNSQFPPGEWTAGYDGILPPRR